MQQPITHSKTTIISTACGTILSIFNNITPEDLVKTTVLAAVGAGTSFIISILLKIITRYLFRKRTRVR